MSFLEALLAKPKSTPLSTYTTWNGVFYFVLGLSFFAWPGQVQLLFGADPFEAGEAGLMRVIGFTVAILGWFYIMGGRTGAASFGLATVVDRVLVPAFLLPLGFSGSVDLHLVVPFAVLDPVLGIGAFIVWKRSTAGSSP
jgi:hypothetical protein